MSSNFDTLYERVVDGRTPAKRPVKYTFSDEITDDQGKEFIHFLEQNTKITSDMRTLDSVPLSDSKWDLFWNVVQETAKKQNALANFTPEMWNQLRRFYNNRVTGANLINADTRSDEHVNDKGQRITDIEIKQQNLNTSNLQNLSFLELYDKQMQSIDVTNRKSFADYQLQPQYMHGQQPPPPPKRKI